MNETLTTIKIKINTTNQKKETKVRFLTYADKDFVWVNSKRTPPQTQMSPMIQENMRIRYER